MAPLASSPTGDHGRRARLAAVLLLLALCACPGAEREHSDKGADSGARQAPSFTLPDLAGERVSLADLRGTTVIVDFWATWCAPCVHQIPVLNEFQAAHADDGVAVFGIAVDSEGKEVVEPFAREHAIAYPILLGSEAVARSFGAIGFPTLFVVAPDGTIDSVHVGVAAREDLEQALARARAAVGES